MSTTNTKTKNQRKRGQRQDAKFTAKGDRKQGRQQSQFPDPYRSEMTDENSTKGQRRAVEISDSAAVLARDNPVAYYTKFSKFAMDSAKLPFSMPLGSEVSVQGNDEVYTWYVPGVMRIRFTPTIGVSDDFSSPINRSSNRFYTYLRSNQKASGKYNHQDITMMEVAMDSCYMFHALLTRIYKIVRDFTPVNQYYPRALVAACGAIYDDVKANLQDFRSYINAYAYNLGQYAMPANVTLFDRHRWMCEGLYTDSSSTRAQTYIFVPDGFWLYDNTVETGSQCTFLQYLTPGPSAGQHTVAELMTMGNQLLNAVSGDEDFAYISGDIYNFFGGDVYKLPYLNENDAVLPSYSEIVLSQIENATVTGPLLPSSLVISQNPSVNEGAIIFKPAIDTTLTYVTHNYSGAQGVPMNFHHDSPSSEDVIEASRLMVTLDLSMTAITVKYCATEIVTTLDVFSRNPATGAYRSNPVYSNTLEVNESNLTLASMIGLLTDVSHLAQFDWAPQVELFTVGTDLTNRSFVGSTWDIDNYDQIKEQYLKNIHMACLFSLFEVGNNREGDVVQ